MVTMWTAHDRDPPNAPEEPKRSATKRPQKIDSHNHISEESLPQKTTSLVINHLIDNSKKTKHRTSPSPELLDVRGRAITLVGVIIALLLLLAPLLLLLLLLAGRIMLVMGIRPVGAPPGVEDD